MEYGTRDCNRSRLLARDSLERKQFVNFPRGIKGHSMSTIQRFEENEFIIACSQCSNMKKKLNQLFEEFDDQELFIQHLSILLDMVYQKHNNLEDEFSKWSYRSQRHALKMNLELRDHLVDAISQLNLILDEVRSGKTRLAEAAQHAQERSYELSQEIRDLKQRLEKSKYSKRALSIQLQQSLEDLTSTKEKLNRTQDRLAEADQRAQERSYALSQEIRDIKQRLEKSESRERAIIIQLQQSRTDLKSTKEELERTQARFKEKSKQKDEKLNPHLQQSHEQVNIITRELEDTKIRLIEANHRKSETDKSNARDTSDFRKLLENSKVNERALKQQLRETKDNLKQMNEQFAEIKTKQNEALHAIRIQLKDKCQEVSDLRKQLDISKTKEATCNHQIQHVEDKLQKTTTELEDTKMRLNKARTSEEDNSHLQDIGDLKKLLEQSQVNERALQHQLRQTQDNLKKITEEFSETKIKETSKAKDKEFDTLLQTSKVQVNITTKELQDTQSRLNEFNQMAQMKEKRLTRVISELRQNINELKLKNETLNVELQQTREDLRKTTLKFEEERKRQNETLDGVRTQLNDKSQEVSDLRKMLDTSKAKEATFNHQMQHVQDKLQKTTTELEDTKTRLSKLMGQQLTDNNPNITDLSDKNRPTKLSERFSELYDNEWTDAFEVLGSIYKDERTTVITLITILKDADKYCREEAEKQMERLRKDLTLNMETGGSDIPSLINKQMKDCRKALATEAGQHLFEVYTKELSQISPTRDSAKSALRVTAFLREAFMLCWLMTIQDPPVVFDRLLQHGEKFNTELYRSYTKSGPLVDFPVWPTMFLHEGGPVLYKGVAQGCQK